MKSKLFVIPILSLVGLFDAAYLTASHFKGTEVACSIIKGCDVVLASTYSTVLGAPLSLIGLLFYLSIFVLSVVILASRNHMSQKLLKAFATCGFLASLYFVYLQAFVIGAWCQFCLLSALLSTLIFISSFLFYKNKPHPQVSANGV